VKLVQHTFHGYAYLYKNKTKTRLMKSMGYLLVVGP